VRGRFGALEHEWKDGDPWLSERGGVAPLKIQPQTGVPGRHVFAEVQPEALRTIMEGKTNCDFSETAERAKGPVLLSLKR
jgi:hypothetical protein